MTTRDQLDIESAASTYRALLLALTGGETVPTLWRLTWLSCLLSRVAESGWPLADDEDPTATLEMLREVRALHDGIMDAMVPLAAAQERQLQEAKAS